MMIEQVSVHSIRGDELVNVRRLTQSGMHVLTIGGVDFYAETIDTLAELFGRAALALGEAAATEAERREPMVQHPPLVAPEQRPPSIVPGAKP